MRSRRVAGHRQLLAECWCLWHFQGRVCPCLRQVEGARALPAPLPGCGAERKARLGEEQGARAHSTRLWGVLPSLPGPWAPWHGCQVSKPFWCSQVRFSSTSLHHHHKLPALLYRQTLFPSSCLPRDQGWGMQRWHRPCAGMRTLAVPQWGVNCWYLQLACFTSLVCTLQKSESKILGSPTRP